MKLGKINFFKRMYLAITDFRMYPYIKKEKLYRAIGYFLKLVIFVSVILGAFITSNIFKELPTLLEIYEKNMPEFSVVNGALEVETSVQKELNGDIYLVLDDEYTYNTMQQIIIESEEMYDYYVLVLSDSAVLSAGTEDGIIELGRIEYESAMNITKTDLANEWRIFNESSLSKIIIWVSISIGMFIVMTIIRLWTLVMYIVSAYIINIMFGLKLKLTEYLKIVIYASTLSTILETISLVYVGVVTEVVNFISVLISTIYIFYALRAIKLDLLILGGNGKTPEEKIKNALFNAQEELKKQLNELEKQEENLAEDKEQKTRDELNRELKEKEDNLIKAQEEYEEAVKKAMDADEKNEENEENKK